MKNILLIPQMLLPIPSVGGGAVEQLITYLLEMNDRFKKVKFIVISKHDEKAASTKYKNSKVYYYSEGTQNCTQTPFFNIRWIFYHAYCKIFLNSFMKKIFSTKTEPLSKYQYFCKYIIKKESIDAVSLEGHREPNFAFINNLVGEDNLYTHLHTARKENLSIRKIVKNSISISQYVHDSWVVDNTIGGKNIVVYNSADVEAFNVTPDEELRKTIKARFGFAEDDFIIVYCGRIIPEKGVKELLQAMALLNNPKIKLLLIGSVFFSAKETSEYEQEILKIIESNPNIVSTGFIHNSKLPDIYSTCGLQVIPSTCQEGAGVVSIEGMAAGLPLIVTESGGMVEYVNDETAIKVPIDDNLSQTIADAIIHLYNNPEKRKSMSEAGRERAKLFSKENYYENFVKIFVE